MSSYTENRQSFDGWPSDSDIRGGLFPILPFAKLSRESLNLSWIGQLAAIRISFESIDVRDNSQRWLEYWIRLVGDRAPSFFLSPEAVATWIDHCSSSHTLRFVLGHESGTPVIGCIIGQAPFARHKLVRGSAIHLNVSGTPADDFLYMEYNDLLLVADTDAREAQSQLLDYLINEWATPWDEFVIPGLAADSRLAAQIRSAPPTSFNVVADKTSRAPYVDLDAIRNADVHFIDTLSSNTRSQIRQAIRTYKRDASVHIEAAQTAPEAIQIFRELIQLHQARWESQNQMGAFSRSAQIAFHEDLISRCFPRKSVELLRVKCGETTIACLYCFLYHKRFYYYQSGFNYSEDNRKRPGLVAHYLAIQRAIKKGYSTYEFLAGHDRYKVSLSNRTKRMEWIRLQRPRLGLRIEELLRQGKAAFES